MEVSCESGKIRRFVSPDRVFEPIRLPRTPDRPPEFGSRIVISFAAIEKMLRGVKFEGQPLHLSSLIEWKAGRWCPAFALKATKRGAASCAPAKKRSRASRQ